VTARKPSDAKVKVIVRTDAVVVAGTHYHYGQAVTLSADQAKPLLAGGRVEKAE
jgi:hypothetical protein